MRSSKRVEATNEKKHYENEFQIWEEKNVSQAMKSTKKQGTN